MWNDPAERPALERLLSEQPPGVERLRALIGLAYLDRRDPEACTRWIDEADAIIDAMVGEPAREAADLWYVRQYCAGEAGERHDAILMCQKALQAYEDLDDVDGIVASLLSLTHYHTVLNHHASAQRYANQLRTLADDGDVAPRFAPAVLYELAHAFLGLGLLDFAMKYAAGAAEHEQGQFGGMLMLSMAEVEAGEYADALEHSERATDAAGDVVSWALAAAEVRARAFHGLGQLDDCREVLEQSLTHHPESSPGYGSVAFELGRVLRDLDDVDGAERWLRTALDTFDVADSVSERASVLRELGELYVGAGRDHEAVEHLRAHIDLSEQATTRQQQAELAALAAEHEFELTNKQLEVTRLKARSLAHHNEVLRVANAEQQEILHVVAHDLATPLHTIGLTATVIRDAVVEGVRATELAGKIVNTVDFMDGVLGQLTLLGRVEGADLTVERTDVAVVEVVGDVVEMLQAAASQRDIEIDVDLDGPSIVRGDRLHVTRIVQNLVSNAVKFSPRGSQVSVTSRSVTGEGREVVGEAAIAVTDRGVGISPNDLDKLFAKFSRLDNHPDDVTTTTGLGLYLSQRLARLMGGEIRADSAGPGRGATFTLRLPTR